MGAAGRRVGRTMTGTRPTRTTSGGDRGLDGSGVTMAAEVMLFWE